MGGISERREEREGFRRTDGGRGLNLKEHNSRGKGGTGQPHAQDGWRTYYIACVGVDLEPGIDTVPPLGRVIKSRVVRVPREEGIVSPQLRVRYSIHGAMTVGPPATRNHTSSTNSMGHTPTVILLLPRQSVSFWKEMCHTVDGRA